MRSLVGFLLALAAGCFSGLGASDLADDGGVPRGCVNDIDCVGAGPSCCGCPEYAVSATSEYAMACEDVDCPAPVGCSAAPRCDDLGQCVLACAAVPCGQTCAGGFAADTAGCLTCTCNTTPLTPECTAASDCTRVPADCCGCAMGGSDTAVPTTRVDEHNAGLGCTGTPTCPGVDACPAGATVRCDGGHCVFDAGGPVTPPAGACGTPDLPPCPPGQTCVLNSDGGATMSGVGICQ